MANVLGEKIRRHRKSKKLTLEQLADKIGSAKFKLAAALGVPPDYLMDDTKNELIEDDRDQVFFSKFRKLDEREKEVMRKFLDAIKDGID